MLSSPNPLFEHRVAPRFLPELMDGECSYEDFRACLHDLEKVNSWLMGYRPTLAWLEHMPGERSKPLRIMDVGSGGGDLLRRIDRWAWRRGIAVELTGIDLNPYAAWAAAERTQGDSKIRWVTADALHYRPERPIDIALSALMTHHLEDEEIVAYLQWMEATARVGWFINDLERSEFASRAFGWLARAAGWHHFVRHDGPVSFRRAFRKHDWVRLLAFAGIPLEKVTIERCRPGRLCVGRWK